jgi:hypothetical protein
MEVLVFKVFNRYFSIPERSFIVVYVCLWLVFLKICGIIYLFLYLLSFLASAVKLLVIPFLFYVVLLGECLYFWSVYLILVFLLFLIERCSVSVGIAWAVRLGVGAIS